MQKIDLTCLGIENFPSRHLFVIRNRGKNAKEGFRRGRGTVETAAVCHFPPWLHKSFGTSVSFHFRPGHFVITHFVITILLTLCLLKTTELMFWLYMKSSTCR